MPASKQVIRKFSEFYKNSAKTDPIICYHLYKRVGRNAEDVLSSFRHETGISSNLALNRFFTQIGNKGFLGSHGRCYNYFKINELGNIVVCRKKRDELEWLLSAS